MASHDNFALPCRSLILDMFDKVDVLEYYDDVLIRSATTSFMLPAVLRVRCFVRKHSKHGHVSINRRNIFLRDNNSCQ